MMFNHVLYYYVMHHITLRSFIFPIHFLRFHPLSNLFLLKRRLRGEDEV